MSISTVTTDDLRRMNGKEGLVLQGCGGDPQEWLDGINGLLTDEGILKNGSKFENISVFQNGELTNILFPFEGGLGINMGGLAMWRLRSHEQFGGTWLSDYIPNRLGGFITEHEPDKIKPDCRLIGEDGNIFNLMGLAARTLRRNGLAEQASEMTGRIHECGSYDEALCIIGEYVNITGEDETEDMDKGGDEPMTYDEWQKKTAELYRSGEVYTSPDFQCDQTGGFPTSLCVCGEQNKAWLELNENLLMDRDDMELGYYRDLCADYGIRSCCDIEDFNRLLQGLGEDAVQSAELFPDEGEGFTMGGM